MYTLRGTLLSILGRSSWELVQAISWGNFALGAFATLALWGQKPRSEIELDLRFGITVAAGLFLSPHLNPQDGLLMGLSALWLYGTVHDEPMRRRGLGAVMVLSPLFFLLGETILGGALRDWDSHHRNTSVRRMESEGMAFDARCYPRTHLKTLHVMRKQARCTKPWKVANRRS